MISSRVRRRPKVRKPKLTVPELTEQFLELKRLRRQVGELEAAGSERPPGRDSYEGARRRR